jgi:two-component system, LytTR family, response regulator
MSSAIPTFVVDDEPLARERICQLLRDDAQIQLLGSYASAAEAERHAQRLSPQLMFLDVRMPERDGLQLLESLSREAINPYVIFITAYSDRSMDALAAGAVDYITKPFDNARFARAVTRAKLLIGSQSPDSPVTSRGALHPLRSRSRLLIAERGKITVLVTRDIEFVQADAKFVKIHAGGRCYTHRRSLGELESYLDAANFVRIHRSTLVNIEHIAEMHSLFHGDCELILRRGTRLTLSRRYRERLAPFLLD